MMIVMMIEILNMMMVPMMVKRMTMTMIKMMMMMSVMVTMMQWGVLATTTATATRASKQQ